MTDQEKWRTVAEWCGYTVKFVEYECDDKPEACQKWVLVHPDGRSVSATWHAYNEETAWRCLAPDYLNSLDACAEFERVASERKLDESYWLRLWDQVFVHPWKGRISVIDAVTVQMATPTQRVEAILAAIKETRDA